MKYLVYLFTLLFSTAVAQNPTILQGNYVSNVFGQANFVLNPNAQTSTTNVTLTNATATRSTTTPLVATTEFNVTVTSANGTITWATRSFDAGMKNQNCEARFTYRGFQATSKAQIKQGANVVAELTLTPSATDPRIASINFPCGDLSAATTFVITDSATLSGVHEIGGIYVGLATNQANVAQAEVVVRASKSTNQTVPAGANTKITYQSEQLDTNNYWDTSTSTFTATKPGCYKFEATMTSILQSWQTGAEHYLFIIVNGNVSTRINGDRKFVTNTGTIYAGNKVVASSCFDVGETAEVYYYHNRTTNAEVSSNVWYTRLTVTRFPSSSELVVTPETQNVWGGVRLAPGMGYAGVGSGTAPTASAPFVNANFSSPSYRTLFGKCDTPTTSSSHLGCSIENMPVGKYKVSFDGLAYVIPDSTGVAICTFEIRETTTPSTVADRNVSTYRDSAGIRDYDSSTLTGIFDNTSVGTRNFIVQATKRAGTSGSICNIGSSTSGNLKYTFLTIEPIDNNSNSALYVQGPVKAGNTGTAAPAGYIGEVINSTSATSGTVSTGVITATRMTITLTPGTWLLHGGMRFNANVTYNFNNLSISPSTAYDPSYSIQPQPAVAGSWNTHANLSRVVTVTSNVTYYLVTLTWITSGSATYDNAIFTATRIGSN